ncbi:TPA: hypothetical protein N0F65_011914 [Lagenidium giganteum]|uniref:Cyclic nucleotide-binding domain-containing protein n=1 Tax=Lagenidium giganteum TaxID=4803 RepID=A0AAV2YUE7_9STRA|nr:TPA: hypothetical protein N0F65_011914 [Lagenidium giganteum]
MTGKLRKLHRSGAARGSVSSFRETFRHRQRSGSAEFLYSEIKNAFDPNSPVILAWQQIVLLCILYEVMVLPYTITFDIGEPGGNGRSALIGVYVCECLFLLDIYVQMHTGYYDDGNILRDSRKSRLKYLRSAGFILDLIPLPPLSLLPEPLPVAAPYMELHKLIRVWKIPKLITMLDDVYARHFVVLKLLKVLSLTMFVSHFVACGRYSFPFDDEARHNHCLPESGRANQSVWSKYLMSLFWAFGLLTGLFEGELPHKNEEFVFTIFVALCGFSLFTYLCATFFTLSKCEGGENDTAEARVNQFKHLLEFHRVARPLQQQAVEYLKRYYTQAEANDREAAKLLCPSIAKDIQIELLQSTVADIPVFKGCDVQFIQAVTSLLELVSLPAQFLLFKTGDHGDAMYVVNSGVLHTVVNGVKVRELRKGSFFGEVAVFARLPRSATVVTTTYCTLYRLSRFHTEKLLEGYPRFARLIAKTIDQMLKKEANQSPNDKLNDIATAAVSGKSKKKRSSFLQVVALKRTLTDQTNWRTKKSARVRPQADGSTNSTKEGVIAENGGHGEVESTSVNVAPQHQQQHMSIAEAAASSARKILAEEDNDNVSAPTSRHISSKMSSKVHPQPSPTSTSSRTSSIRRRSILQASSTRLASGISKLRSTLQRRGNVRATEDKSPDVMKGFYDGLARNAPPPPPTPRWWFRFLLHRCLDADSPGRMVWLFVLQIALAYNWVSTPLLLAFPLLNTPTWYMTVLDAVADIILWIDIYINLNLSYSVSSEKIFDTKRSAQRYVASHGFVLDVVVALPYSLLLPSSVHHSVGRLPRLLRSWRLRGHFGEVGDFFVVNSRKRLMLSGMLLLMLYHVIACLHFSITYLVGFSPAHDAWLPSDDLYLQVLTNDTFQDVHGNVLAATSNAVTDIKSMQYFRSFYYAANVLTGLGRTIEPNSTVAHAVDTQYSAALVFMLSGFLITAVVVDNVQKRFTASAFEQKEFFATRTRIQLFLKRQNAPMSLHQRVNSFLDFWWSSHRGAIVGELLNELPETIKRDIVRSICRPALESLALLLLEDTSEVSQQETKDAHQRMEQIFLDNLRIILYGQGEIIYRQGDYAAGLYFLLDGHVSLVHSGSAPRQLPLGGFFGTASLAETSTVDGSTKASFSASPSVTGYAERVTALSGCIVVYVSREHLQAMQSEYAALSVGLRSLERRLVDAKVIRTSQIERSMPRSVREARLSVRASLQEPPPTAALASYMRDEEMFSISHWSTWARLRDLVLDPDSPWIRVWETWLFAAMSAQVALVIFHTCFGVSSDNTGGVFVREDLVTVLLELCFLGDMIIRFHLGFYEYGNKVMDRSVITKHYVRSRHFAIDALALLPLFALNWLLGAREHRLEILNLNKLLRVFKVSSQLHALESKYVKLTMELRLFKLVYYTFLASHLFGCLWFDFAVHASGLHSGMLDGDLDTFGNNETAKWLPPASLRDKPRSLQYFASLFWSFGLMSASSPGELPKTTAQCLFSVLTMTVGFFLFAYVVGNFSDVIELQDADNRQFVAKLSSLRHLLRHFKLPTAIDEKFKNYFFFKRFHSITQEHVLERVLPPSLMVDIRMFQLQPMIVKVAFMTGMEDAVTRMLVALFTQVLYVKDEFICKFGEEGSEMYFVFTGVLDIYVPIKTATAVVTSKINSMTADEATSQSLSYVATRNMQKVNQITAGSYFGEAALFTNSPRNAFVKASTSCILYRLSRQSLELVFERYPDWKRKVLRIVQIQQEQQRLTRLAQEEQANNPSGAPGSGAAHHGRRRGLKRNVSRLDALSSRTDEMDEVLLTYAQRGVEAARVGGRKRASSVEFLIKHTHALVFFYRWIKPVARQVRTGSRLLMTGARVQSRFYLWWIKLVSVCTVYMAVLVPYRLAYDALDRWNVLPVALRVAEAVCEAVFWLDIWFQCHVHDSFEAMEFYEQDHLQTYKRERLWWDVLAAFPFDHWVAEFVADPVTAEIKKWSRLNRCLKVVNLVHYRSEINRRSVSFEINKLQTLSLLYLLVIFWTSCAYFAVAMIDGFGTEWQAWLPAAELAEADHLSTRILRGLFFATTAFVKKGRTFVPDHSTLDYVFSILVCFVGQLVMALMIGEIANVFILYIDNEVEFRKNQIAVEFYLARWKVSAALRARVSVFLTSWWSSHAGVNYQLIFSELPPSVRTEGILFIADKPLQLLMEKVFRPLSRGALHEGTDQQAHMSLIVDNLMHSIAQHLRFEGYPRGENVVVEGSVCKAMYFVVKGYLYSRSQSNPTLYHATRFRQGDYFGDKGLLGHSVSLMTVTTVRACDLFALSSQQLLETLQNHGYFQVVLRLAQDMVRQKKSLEEYFRDEQQEKDAAKRRVSAPELAQRDGRGATKRRPLEATTYSPHEAQLHKLLKISSDSDWDDAFQLFMQMIVPNGSLSGLGRSNSCIVDQEDAAVEREIETSRERANSILSLQSYLNSLSSSSLTARESGPAAIVGYWRQKISEASERESRQLEASNRSIDSVRSDDSDGNNNNSQTQTLTESIARALYAQSPLVEEDGGGHEDDDAPTDDAPTMLEASRYRAISVSHVTPPVPLIATLAPLAEQEASTE